MALMLTSCKKEASFVPNYDKPVGMIVVRDTDNLGQGKIAAKKNGYRYTFAAAGFAIAWILHGAYDFGLSDDFAALGEDTAFLSVSLALLALITFIVMIIFFAKKNKKEKYLVPLA